jgi:hypothetical protein
MKSFGPFEIKSEDKGEVVAVVATLGVVDKDGDVIMPGAFGAGAKVKLSGYGHDVITEGKAPVGKGVITEEGDRAVFRGQFFMSTSRGREAFHTTKELGAEGEWSFGFPKSVKTGEMSDEWKAKGAKRIIKGLQAIEASPVFVGAGWGTGTLSAKAAEVEMETPEAASPEEFEIVGMRVGDEVVPVVMGGVEAPAEPVETEEAKAAREAAELEVKAQMERVLEAVEEFERVQRALKRMGYAA